MHDGPGVMLDTLGEDLLHKIVSFLSDSRDVCSSACTCRIIRRVAVSDRVWQPLFEARPERLAWRGPPQTPFILRFREVTERQRARERLAELRARLRLEGQEQARPRFALHAACRADLWPGVMRRAKKQAPPAAAMPERSQQPSPPAPPQAKALELREAERRLRAEREARAGLVRKPGCARLKDWLPRWSPPLSRSAVLVGAPLSQLPRPTYPTLARRPPRRRRSSRAARGFSSPRRRCRRAAEPTASPCRPLDDTPPPPHCPRSFGMLLRSPDRAPFLVRPGVAAGGGAAAPRGSRAVRPRVHGGPYPRPPPGADTVNPTLGYFLPP